MSADIAALPQKVRAKILRGRDEHWLWIGGWSGGAPSVNGQYVKPMAWQSVTGEALHPGECVIRDCSEGACVNPDHQHIGTLTEAAAVGRQRRWSA